MTGRQVLSAYALILIDSADSRLRTTYAGIKARVAWALKKVGRACVIESQSTSRVRMVVTSRARPGRWSGVAGREIMDRRAQQRC